MQTYNPRQTVELFHLLFLGQLGRKLDKNLYSLKGGCNMRFYFNSIRYSEDMDIDVQKISKETLHKSVNQILNSIPFQSILQTKSLAIQTSSAPKQTETTQRWKITLKSTASSLPLNTKIEFSRRSLDQDKAFEAIHSQILRQYSLPPIMANHYCFQSMYEQKIAALALRTETQARDIFDLYLLICSGNNLKPLNTKTAPHLPKAIANAMNISFTDFKGQVIAYLSENYQKQYDDKELWNNIVDTVVQALEDHPNEAT